MQDLLGVLNQIFFFGAIPDVEFTWKLHEYEWRGNQPISPSEQKHPFGRCTSSPNTKGYLKQKIYLSPTSVPPRCQSNMHAERLGILLHEMTHAFLAKLACQKCCTAADNNGLLTGGHGRAWHRIAAGIENAAPRLLGCGVVDLGRVESLRSWYLESAVGNFPSVHDLMGFGLLSGDAIEGLFQGVL